MSYDVCVEYGACKKVIIDDLGDYSGEWYFLSITPLPEENDLISVMHDIMNNNIVSMTNGKLEHYSECDIENHKLPKPFRVVAKSLDNMSFKLAIYNNPKKVINEQPLIVCIDPEVSFSKFPHHPHLNSPIPQSVGFFPATLCYTNQPETLGSVSGNRIFDAAFIATIWLFRHQVWLKGFELYQKSMWLGPEAESDMKNGQHINFLNPEGLCKCGKNRKYRSCCMSKDIEMYDAWLKENHDSKVNISRKISDYILHWNSNVKAPEEAFLSLLRTHYEKSELG